MNWPSLAEMKGQHAPAPGALHARPSSPVHTAENTAQSSAPVTTEEISQRPSTVRRLLVHEENKLARSQPMTPMEGRGGRITWAAASAAIALLSVHRSTNAMRRLNQFMKADVSRLKLR